MERKCIPCDWSTFVCVGGIIMYRSILIGWLAAVVLVSSCCCGWWVEKLIRAVFVHSQPAFNLNFAASPLRLLEVALVYLDIDQLARTNSYWPHDYFQSVSEYCSLRRQVFNL